MDRADELTRLSDLLYLAAATAKDIAATILSDGCAAPDNELAKQIEAIAEELRVVAERARRN